VRSINSTNSNSHDEEEESNDLEAQNESKDDQGIMRMIFNTHQLVIMDDKVYPAKKQKNFIKKLVSMN